MKRYKHILLAALCFILLLIGCTVGPRSCKMGKLDFSVSEPLLHTSEYGDYATVTVTSTCTGGFIYDSSYPHGIEGGKPTLILPDGRELEFYCNVDAMETTLDMKPGNYTRRTWEFWFPDDVDYDLSEGEYAIRVTWLGFEETIEGIRFTRFTPAETTE